MANKASSMLTAAGIVILFITVICVGGYFAITQYVADSQNQNNNQQQTTPPPTDATANWNMMQNNATGFGLKFPAGFFDGGHDPQIFVGTCKSQDCKAIGETVAGVLGTLPWQNPNGEKLRINNVDYLLCQSSDAAAGHTYQNYYYLTVKNQQCIVAYMATSQTRCENYLPLQAGNTEQEKNYNDCVAKNAAQPATLQQIVNTFTFTK